MKYDKMLIGEVPAIFQPLLQSPCKQSQLTIHR